MLIIPDDKVSEYLAYPELIEALREIFLSDYTLPLRHHHFYKNAEGEENTLILMPVWNKEYIGMKQVTVAPGNAGKNIPAIFAQYILSNAITGQPLALMNAAQLTSRRTACTSALASSFLSREDAENLLIIGGGAVATHLVEAHLAVRKFKKVNIWMRNQDKLIAFVNALKTKNIDAEAVTDLEKTAREADVISCATLSKTPVIKGEWIKPGTHLDMIGSHKPDTRETDNEAIRKSSIFVDSRMGALHETGELALPIAERLISEKDIQADIVELVKGTHPGRKSQEEITLFKSAGLAVEDLAAALLVFKKFTSQSDQQ
ncbi:ornithine cyclodeaminase family protein [Dyadobacter psychrotolerans]|uniref:Ornithine cyclodeaminase family protein n=1 Tax=Dyadobacter psychrotolerans TaxID=2541721 RepID=A0A4R5DY05_9BACT|nr:ornithine cyclodeaminase family protein [Dyadobacter psychrotolerans]TDE17360.1 ornithine cyclodeaminase family protein [Dyadobacter psychrotolerans]